ncbi:MAG: DUF6011 domain-containing protein [Gemmatimonadaceae bacterium]
MIPFPADEAHTEAPRTKRCGACPRVLTDPVSVARGFGPCCAKRLGLLTAAGSRVRLGSVRAGGDVEGQGDLLGEEA